MSELDDELSDWFVCIDFVVAKPFSVTHERRAVITSSPFISLFRSTSGRPAVSPTIFS